MACCGVQTLVLKTIALIALGTAIGLIDSVRRPITLGGRITDVDIADVFKSASESPKTPVAPPDQSVPAAAPGAAPAAAPGAASVVAAPAASAVEAKPGEPGWQPTPKDRLPKGQITLEEAKRAFDSGASFVDARRAEEYEAGHVQGAIRMNLKSFENGNPPLMAMIPRDGVVIVYCGGGKCDESERVAEQFNNSGYAKVFIIHDGFPGWKAMGWPVETGEGLQ